MPEVAVPRDVWRLSAVIAFGAFMSGLDASVVNVGLDTIARDLHSGLAETQWVANGYLLALAVSLPACAWLGRRVGAGRLWLAALVAFTFVSALCSAAPSVGWLIALRVAQGLAAGLLIPAGQTIIGQAAGPARLGQVMATLGMAVALAPALGPTVGGLLLSAGSWPWLFLINVPIGAIALLLGRRLVPRDRGNDPGRLDVLGLLLITAGLPLVVYGLTAWGEQRALARLTVGPPLLAGVLALAAYVAWSRRRERPVLDLRLFARGPYRAAAATAAFSGAAMFGAGLLFPLYFQLARDQDALGAGLSLVSMGVGTAIVAPLAGGLVDRLGGGVVAVAGGLASVATTLPFAVLGVHADVALVQVLLLVRGMAVALATIPAAIAAYKAVRPDELPDATTQINILQRVGGALGGAIFSTIVATRIADGPSVAFHVAFGSLASASILGLASAWWLLLAERGQGRGPDDGETSDPGSLTLPQRHALRSPA